MSDQPLGADPTDAHTSGLPAAVLGTGQTHHVSRRTDVSMAGLCREAIDAAMADAGVGWDDIDAVIVGKAPDLFEGVMMPELMMADALGAVGKPLLRVHTAGSVGAPRDRGRLARPVRTLPPCCCGLGEAVRIQRHVALSLRRAVHRRSAPVRRLLRPPRALLHPAAPAPRAWAPWCGQDRLNGSINPYAHLKQPEITVDKVLQGQMLWDPIRFDETCPSSDGACAIVIGDAEAAEAVENAPAEVAWIRATALRTEPGTAAATTLTRRPAATPPTP